MTCERGQWAAELALETLPGPERAQALAHLARCAECRAIVADLVPVADGLVRLVRPEEPPPGFEQRVLSRLSARPRRRRRPLLVAAVALAAALAGAVVGALLGDGRAPERVVTAALVAAAGGAEGEVVAYGWAPDRTLLVCSLDRRWTEVLVAEAVLDDGAVVGLGKLRADAPFAYGWEVPAGVQDVVELRLRAEGGPLRYAADLRPT